MVTDQLCIGYSTKFTSSMVLDLARFAKGAYTVYVTNGRTQASQVVTRF
ncbi:MAG: hypothetical protein H6597_00075 [Flavobacteriales bacterium]|nr:hypothetical protein [Flavobacteriales bacterium]